MGSESASGSGSMSGLGSGSGLKPGSGRKAKKIQAQYLSYISSPRPEDYISTKQVERERDREETATDTEIHRHDRY